MNKVAHYLQEHLIGEVMTGSDARRYFSTDGSILSVTPAIIVYPRNENDVRKAARFTWQLAERGKVIPITARGSGTDQSGAALGEGIVMAFPAHMNKVLELDGKTGDVVVEPGINFGKLQQTLFTHNRFLPTYPSSFEYSTVGGAVANNSAGERSVKYGSTASYVNGLRVVLANGEVIVTGRISKREVNKKLGLATFEGEIYRNLDALIDENSQIIKNMKKINSAAGYAIGEVKNKNGSMDLTPLFVGSQGTLGIVTEIGLSSEPHNPNTTLVTANVNDYELMASVVTELNKFSEKPCSIEMVNDELLNFVHTHNPNQLKGVVQQPYPKALLLIEFDNPSDRIQKRLAKKTTKLLKSKGIEFRQETDQEARENLWRIRHSATTLISHAENNSKALPIIEDGVVPIEKIGEFIKEVQGLLSKNNVIPAAWGNVGAGVLHVRPLLDLSQVGDRQKAFKLIDEYYSLAVSMGGSTSSGHNDGRLRAPYLPSVYGAEVYGLFEKIKQIFDPYGTLNPGVKIGVTMEDVKPITRQEFSLKHFYDHLPRS
ncbi:FAD-binding oxidoreductase [Candidatus Saccharibacteria bacterium]|nr:FAD-binding oxidoreductase [Candidatus Saccharibacteria bacterium]